MKQLLISLIPLLILLGCTPSDYGEGVARIVLTPTPTIDPKWEEIDTGKHKLQFVIPKDVVLSDLCNEYPRPETSVCRYSVGSVYLSVHPKDTDWTLMDWVDNHKSDLEGIFHKDNRKPPDIVFFDSFQLDGWETLYLTGYPSNVWFDYENRVVLIDFYDHLVEIYHLHTILPEGQGTGYDLHDHIFNTILDTIHVVDSE